MSDKLNELELSCVEIFNDAYNKGIKIGLETKWLGRDLICYQTIDSTQSEAHTFAKEDAAHGTVIVASEQKKGRGRLGRLWYSEKDMGVWISIILRPSFGIKEANHITLITSIVINRTLQKLYGIESKIKWPNDIYINDKKCAGILCEMQGDQEDLHYLIVGVGINTHRSNFPEDIKSKATSIEEIINNPPKRLELITEFLNEFEKAYENYTDWGFKYFYNQYLELMYGKKKKILFNNESTGYIIGIDEAGNLLVEDEKKHVLKITSGEIKFLS